jgi:hypothetical protein
MPRKQKKYHYVYRTTCLITGKFYVGMHSTDNLEDGYLGSGKILGYSRRKYGDENHIREILEYVPSRIKLKEREKEIVNEELLANPLNINLKYGGEGGGKIWNKEHAKKFHRAGWEAMQSKVDKSARSKKAWRNSPNMKVPTSNVGGENNPMFGKIHSTKTRNQMSESGLGEKNSQFGTCWVTKDSKPIKIKKEQLDEYLSNGYSRGRK